MESKSPAHTVYGGLVIVEGDIRFSCINKKKSFGTYTIPTANDTISSIISWVRNYSSDNNLKFISIGVVSADEDLLLFSKLWLDLDIVPLSFKEDDPEEAAKYAAAHFDEHNSFASTVGPENKVETPPLVMLENYEEITSPDVFKELIDQVNKFKGKRISYFSATPQGGGVAIMRHALLRLYSLLKVDASWHVLIPETEIFDITKEKFHNVLQSVNHVGTLLTDDDKKLFNEWSNRNFDLFRNRIENSDIVVIDDPQAAGLVPLIRDNFPKVKLIYRSHIQLLADLVNTPETPQYITWGFIWSLIKTVDLFVSHPVPEFVPSEVEKEKLAYMHPSTDPLDGLNKELTDAHKSYYFAEFNKILQDHNLSSLDPNRPYIIQIARFDPSKGIPDVLESYAKLRMLQENRSPIPQLAIVGNSSVDDPDGKPIFQMAMELINENYKDYVDDIKIIQAPHYDQMLNTLLRRSSIALQLSHKEGYEFKVTEALMKGIPTIIYDSGGMPLQVKHGKTGFIVEKGNTNEVAKYMYQLLTDNELYKNISLQASKNYNKEATTVPNALNWLKISNNLI